MRIRDQIIEVYGPQLGELAWHSLHADDRLAAVSQQHAASILDAVRRYGIRPAARQLRILEVGAYAHFGAHSAAASLGGISVAHDVSPASLRIGLEGARAAGINPAATLVAGDFHDLPFTSGYFDVVFCASSVHHTFRPRLVLQEMLRVLRPGGLLQLENEPIGRALCFYGFRSNRQEQFTPFEAELASRGSLFTISSPFPGSRPEMLFGMIENDRIPLDMIIGPLNAAGKIVSLHLTPQISLLDRSILALPGDDDLEKNIASILLSEVEHARELLTERDRLLGVRLPETDDVWRLSYEVAPGLRRLAGLKGPEAERETARLFGAALKATVIRHGGRDMPAAMFRRQPAVQDGVHNDLPILPGVLLHLTEQSIVAIENGDPDSLARVYPGTDWEFCREHNGLVSMLNLGPRCRIVLPAVSSAAILMLRFYAVASDRPYRASLRSREGAPLASVVIAAPESFLIRELVPERCEDVYIETTTLDGHPIDLPRHLRLGVGRLIPVEMTATPAAK